MKSYRRKGRKAYEVEENQSQIDEIVEAVMKAKGKGKGKYKSDGKGKFGKPPGKGPSPEEAVKAKGRRKGKKSKSKAKGYTTEAEDGTDGPGAFSDDDTADVKSDGGRPSGSASGHYDESYWQGDDGWTLAWVPSSDTWWSGDTWSTEEWSHGWYASEFSEADGTASSSLAYRRSSRDRTTVSSWKPNLQREKEFFH